MDICLLELAENVIETGRISNVLLRTICLPENETAPGSRCFTSGFNRDSKIIDAVELQLLNPEHCENHINYYGEKLIENQLCAGILSSNNSTIAVSGKYQEDYGGPLICLDEDSDKPIFAGIASYNSLSTKHGQPGMIQSVFSVHEIRLKI